MEKLTEKTVIAGIEAYDLKTGIPEEKAFDRLGQYEATGLTIEQYKEIADLFSEIPQTDIPKEVKGFAERAVWHCKKTTELSSELQRVTKIRDDYAATARTIALWLDEFCNRSLPYDQMIADASRKACEEICKLRKLVNMLSNKVRETDGLDKISVDSGYLTDWYINSITSDDPPVWTEEHIYELTSDFVIIPKESVNFSNNNNAKDEKSNAAE